MSLTGILLGVRGVGVANLLRTAQTIQLVRVTDLGALSDCRDIFRRTSAPDLLRKQKHAIGRGRGANVRFRRGALFFDFGIRERLRSERENEHGHHGEESQHWDSSLSVVVVKQVREG